MVIPRFDLAVSAPPLIDAARRIASGRGTGEPRTLRRFESELADWLGPQMSTIFTLSARGGLWLILDGLRALGRFAPERNLVIVPSWTHASVPVVVAGAGFSPWFVDCNPSTLNADPEGVPADVWTRAAAVIVTHLYGTPAETERWIATARAHGVAVIEDCAQALGARTPGGAKCGTLGDASYFSFQLTKNFTTLGGGAVATRDAALLARMQEGVSERPSQADRGLFAQVVKGLAFRLATRPSVFALTVYPALRAGWALTGRDLLHEAFDEAISFSPPRGVMRAPAGIQADVGRTQLPTLEAANARRTAIGTRLHALLEGVPGVRLPAWPAGSEPIFMSFVLRVGDRMSFMRELLRQGVDSSPGYLRACHRLSSLDANGGATAGAQEECPHATRLEHEQVHLPIYPRLTDREVEAIARAVRTAAKGAPVDGAPSSQAIPIGRG